MGAKRPRSLRKPASATSGFARIELMIVVAILTILGGIALPTFDLCFWRTRTAEVSENSAAMLQDGGPLLAHRW